MKYILDKSARIGALLLFLALIGCANDGASESDTGIRADTGPDAADVDLETTEPEFRDVRISIGGKFSAEIDLRDADEAQILPATAPAAFKLFVSDDTTPSEELTVEVVDGEGTVLTPTDGPTFRNGLWHVEVEIGPGVSARPKVSDAAGNAAVYDSALVIPARSEAVIGQWRTLFYDAQFEVEQRWLSDFGNDGHWERSQDVDGGWSRSGTFDFAQENLAFTDETRTEWREVGAYYVDETYFARQPLSREGSGEGVVGTWSYEYERFDAAEGDLEPQGTYTTSLSVDDDGTWQETFGATDAGQTRSGTWTMETNAGYAANYGDLLIRTTTHADGDQLQTPVETTDLFVIRLDHLLLSPRIRGHGQ